MNQSLNAVLILLGRKILTVILILSFTQVMAQDENKFQPDSVYKSNRVKRMYVYENSPKDLWEIIDVDPNGQMTKIVVYNASYDRKTRARKRIASVSRFIYDSENRLTEKIDSASYVKSIEETNHTSFFYDENGTLKSSIYYVRKYVDIETEYKAKPFKRIMIRRGDSLITYRDTEEYDKDFYEKRSRGYTWSPTLKTAQVVRGTDTSTYQYSDYKDLKKLDGFSEIANRFNSKGQLISSDINQRFMVNPDTWRTFQAMLIFKYYSNGLLKSNRGYIPYFFKYEFYK